MPLNHLLTVMFRPSSVTPKLSSILFPPLVDGGCWALPGRRLSSQVKRLFTVDSRRRTHLGFLLRRLAPSHFSGSRRNPRSRRSPFALRLSPACRCRREHDGSLFEECRECREGDRKRVWDEEGAEWAVIGFSVTYVAGRGR